MKEKKIKYRKKELNLATIELNTKKFLFGPLWRNEEKIKRNYVPYYISR